MSRFFSRDRSKTTYALLAEKHGTHLKCVFTSALLVVIKTQCFLGNEHLRLHIQPFLQRKMADTLNLITHFCFIYSCPKTKELGITGHEHLSPHKPFIRYTWYNHYVSVYNPTLLLIICHANLVGNISHLLLHVHHAQNHLLKRVRLLGSFPSWSLCNWHWGPTGPGRGWCWHRRQGLQLRGSHHHGTPIVSCLIQFLIRSTCRAPIARFFGGCKVPKQDIWEITSHLRISRNNRP